jgi:diguanylate cyclase (GGDEF)-like protein/PAS domain S-box-containing protein
MKRLPPTLQLAGALVLMTGAILVLIDSLFQVFPDPDVQTLRQRTAVAQTVAAQAAGLIEQGDMQGLSRALESVRKHDPGIVSLGVRRQDGRMAAQTGKHVQEWVEEGGEVAGAHHVAVPLASAELRWGRVEVAFVAQDRTLWHRILRHPRWFTLMALLPVALLMFWLYLRRALAQLDPASVIPQRIRSAFDAMTEGVTVLDHKGRVLLTNQAFEAMQGADRPEAIGRPLSAMTWLKPALPAQADEHPWHLAMREGRTITNYAIHLAGVAAPGRKLAVNCAPVLDDRGKARGCLVTFDDLTELHYANEQLSDTLLELHRTQGEIERKNRELEHLASHDVLTGCLTRRAFFDQMTVAFEDARRSGLPLSCAVVDIDRFKSVNDTRGHALGDRVVQEIGRELLGAFRASDIIGRCGGDEFFIGMPDCDIETAMRIAESLRAAVEVRSGARAGGLSLSVSVGVACMEPGDSSLAQLLERTDRALYAAKTGGRNRVSRATGSEGGRLALVS